MKLLLLRSAAGLVLLASLVACSSHADQDTAAQAGQPSTTAPANLPPVGPALPSAAPVPPLTPGVPSTGPDGVQQVVIDAIYDGFTPQLVRIHRGTARIFLRNNDPEIHNLVLPDNGNARTSDLTAAGQSGSVTAVFNKAGSYDFVCSYHELEGMTGAIVVQ